MKTIPFLINISITKTYRSETDKIKPKNKEGFLLEKKCSLSRQVSNLSIIQLKFVKGS